MYACVSGTTSTFRTSSYFIWQIQDTPMELLNMMRSKDIGALEDTISWLQSGSPRRKAFQSQYPSLQQQPDKTSLQKYFSSGSQSPLRVHRMWRLDHSRFAWSTSWFCRFTKLDRCHSAEKAHLRHRCTFSFRLFATRKHAARHQTRGWR